MKNLFCFALLCYSLMLIGCSKSSDDPVATITPTNLVLTSSISSDGSGIVTITATADNAIDYVFYFGEVSPETPVRGTNGVLSHTYQTSGTYTVKVIAYSIDKLTVEKTLDVTVTVTISDAGYSTPSSYPGMNLVWQDEFGGDAINSANWSFETGGGGWGNHELEYYQSNNATVKDGYLTIKAKSESVGGNLYTSTRMITKGKQEFLYGRIDIRSRLPKGQGIWPALWMLGADISTVPWPACGEIDIMELIGGDLNRTDGKQGKDNILYGTPHWSANGVHASVGGSKTLSTGIFADKFHVFSIVWTATSITWYLDDVQYHVLDTNPASGADQLDEFRAKFFFIFNIAVGGDWPGSPNSTTVFPQSMLVDYIRIFQN